MNQTPSSDLNELKALNAKAVEKLLQFARDPAYAQHLLHLFNEAPQLKHHPQYAGLYALAQKYTFKSLGEKVGYFGLDIIWTLLTKLRGALAIRRSSAEPGKHAGPQQSILEQSEQLVWPELFTDEASITATK